MNKWKIGLALEIFGIIVMLLMIFGFKLTVINNATTIYWLSGFVFWFGFGLYWGAKK